MEKIRELAQKWIRNVAKYNLLFLKILGCESGGHVGYFDEKLDKIWRLLFLYEAFTGKEKSETQDDEYREHSRTETREAGRGRIQHKTHSFILNINQSGK
jgi:hypothetical protein